MRTNAKFRLLAAAMTLSIGFFLGCTGSFQVGLSQGDCPQGAEACECYPNQTCDSGLECVEDVCQISGDGDADTTGDGDSEPSACGNGMLEADEECDGTNLGGLTTCADLEGFDEGALSCNPDCTLSVDACIAWECGNGVPEGFEHCDGDEGCNRDCKYPACNMGEADAIHCPGCLSCTNFHCVDEIAACEGAGGGNWQCVIYTGQTAQACGALPSAYDELDALVACMKEGIPCAAYCGDQPDPTP